MNRPHKQQLHHIQYPPHGHKRPDGHIPAEAKLQLPVFRIINIEAPAPDSYPPQQEVESRRDEQTGEEEVYEDEVENETDSCGSAVGVDDAPGDGGSELGEREEVCEGGVGAMPGVFLFWRVVRGGG